MLDTFSRPIPHDPITDADIDADPVKALLLALVAGDREAWDSIGVYIRTGHR
jgi:hypothetical protein